MRYSASGWDAGSNLREAEGWVAEGGREYSVGFVFLGKPFSQTGCCWVRWIHCHDSFEGELPDLSWGPGAADWSGSLPFVLRASVHPSQRAGPNGAIREETDFR